MYGYDGWRTNHTQRHAAGMKAQPLYAQHTHTRARPPARAPWEGGQLHACMHVFGMIMIIWRRVAWLQVGSRTSCAKARRPATSSWRRPAPTACPRLKRVAASCAARCGVWRGVFIYAPCQAWTRGHAGYMAEEHAGCLMKCTAHAAASAGLLATRALRPLPDTLPRPACMHARRWRRCVLRRWWSPRPPTRWWRSSRSPARPPPAWGSFSLASRTERRSTSMISPRSSLTGQRSNVS